MLKWRRRACRLMLIRRVSILKEESGWMVMGKAKGNGVRASVS